MRAKHKKLMCLFTAVILAFGCGCREAGETVQMEEPEVTQAVISSQPTVTPVPSVKPSYSPEPEYSHEPQATPEPSVGLGGGGKDSSLPLSGVTIGIDPGHQQRGDSSLEQVGPDSDERKPKVASGTRGVVSGVPEYVVTLAVGLLVRDKLEALGARVVMARIENDVNISNRERALLMNEQGVDFCVRIHCNGSEDGRVQGALMFVPDSGWTRPIEEESTRAGRAILDAFTALTGAANGGVSGRGDLTGFNWSTVPVCLIEMGFMTNAGEDGKLTDPAYQELCAQGIADGIVEWRA